MCWICQGGTEAGDAGSFRETLEAADEETGADDDGDDADEEDDDDDDGDDIYYDEVYVCNVKSSLPPGSLL